MIQIGAPSATIDSPVEHLMACHRRIEQRLDTLVNAADHIMENRAAALDAIAKSLRFLDTSGVLHTEDEESSVFPRLRPKLSASEVAFVDALEAQHDEADALYTELKRLVAGLPDSLARYRACAESLRALYREHIQTEDQQLTSLASSLLTQPELAEITREMRARRA